MPGFPESRLWSIQRVTLSFTMTGPPGPALRALADADLTALAIREPRLEEIFLDYYGEAAR